MNTSLGGSNIELKESGWFSENKFYQNQWSATIFPPIFENAAVGSLCVSSLVFGVGF